MTTPTPAGWLVDDSASFNPYWLAYGAKNQQFVDTYRARGKRVVTMWATPGDAAAAYEAMRLRVAELEARQVKGDSFHSAVTVAGLRVIEDSSLPPGTIEVRS